MSTEQLSKHSKEFEESVRASSGIFCWSNSGSSHSKVSEIGADILSASDGVVIRIPGPQVCLVNSPLTCNYLLSYVVQILGYMLQYVDNDLTQDLNADLPDNFLISDADYEAGFDKINNAPTVPGAAHALAPPVAVSYTETLAAATPVSVFKEVSLPKEVFPLQEVSLPKEVFPPQEVSLPKEVSPPEEEPVYSSGYYFAPKLRV